MEQITYQRKVVGEEIMCITCVFKNKCGQQCEEEVQHESK